MSFDQYQSEEKACCELAVSYFYGHEDLLMRIFIELGPEAMRRLFRVQHNYGWIVIFDKILNAKRIHRPV